MSDPIDQAIQAANETLHRSTEVDYLLVADRAEVTNGKLYLMGGGWDRVQPQKYPLNLMLGIAVGLRIPYQETYDTHKLAVSLERDGQELVKIEAEIQTGRPPGLGGRDLLVPMAFNIPVSFTEPGDYELNAGVDGHAPRKHAIRATSRGTP